MGCSASSSAALGHSEVVPAKDCSQVMNKLTNKEPATTRGNKATANSTGHHISSKAGQNLKHVNTAKNEPLSITDKKDSIGSNKSLSSRDKQQQSPNPANEPTHTQLLVAPANKPGTPKRSGGPCQNSNRTSVDDRSETNVSSMPPVESLPRPHSVLSSKTSDDSHKNKTITSDTSHQTGANNSPEYWKAPTISPLTIQPLPPVFSKIESKSIIFIEEASQIKSDNDNKTNTVNDNIKPNSPTISPTKNNHTDTDKTSAPLEKSPTDPHVSFDSSADSAMSNNRRNLHHIRRHSHHYHHHRKLSVSNCSRSLTPEKTIKITTKDERAQFVFKSVKSRDDLEGGSGVTRDILIQTDVISLNANNEKTKKKLLIKIGKFSSKSSPACIPIPKTRSLESPTNTKIQEQAETQNEPDIVAEVGDGEGPLKTNEDETTLRTELEMG